MLPHFDLTTVPTGVIVIVTILAVVQITLDVVALVDLARRPRERVAFGAKWPWVLIILLINLIGAILYFAIGRQHAPAADEATPSSHGTTAASVADALYSDDGQAK